ncbi:hypothetical protein DFH27DRAFT_512969 [Peziza echinospora]|nr:hypothetical protein DFH27DRAFT_512969 [Peziza echinospora]
MHSLRSLPRILRLLATAAALIAGLSSAPLQTSAHGIPHEPEDADHSGMSWAQIHMLEEHHIANFDPTSFFHLHDYDKSETWTSLEILRTYGIDPADTTITPQKRTEIILDVLKKMDYDNDGAVSLDEFLEFHKAGGVLEDYGVGTGGHGDDEYQYELHHYEKYHSEDTEGMPLDHPEDVEHFKKHAELEAREARQAILDSMSIVVDNIPSKFRRVK